MVHKQDTLTVNMADEVKIDKELFYNRLNQLISAWKNDKRSSNDAVFGGVGSIVILLGKNEEVPSYQKSNALHVSCELYALSC